MKLLDLLDFKGKGSNLMLDTIFDHFGKKNAPEDTEFRKKIESFKNHVPAQRLLDVWNRNVVPLAPDFVAPAYLKSKEESKFIEDALADVFLFQKLARYEHHELISAFEKVTVGKGTEIIKEGDAVEYFYIVYRGAVSQTEGEDLGPSSFFGDLALLYDYNSDSTYTAASDSILWRLDQRTFQRVLAAYTYRGDAETRALLKKVTLFKDLDDAFLTKIVYALKTETYEKGDIIAQKGDECKSFYIIKEGSAKVTNIVIGHSHYDDLTVSSGDSLGEGAIMRDEAAYGDVTALENVTLLCLPRAVFTKFFGNLEDLVTRSIDKKLLMAIPVGNKPKLEEHMAETMTGLIENKPFPKGYVFMAEGRRSPNTLFLIRSGKVSVRSSQYGPGVETLVGIFGHKTVGEETTISGGGYFGLDTLKTPDEGKPDAARYTITSEEECTVGLLRMGDIWPIIMSGAPGGEAIPLNELEMHRILGAGTFGKAWLVSKIGTNDVYALKVQSKRKMIEYGQVEGVIREKNTMARLNHPFIIKLVSSMKDDRNIYMLTNLYPGGEFRSILSTGSRMGVPEEVAVFYAANILQGLSYMHSRRVLHRDMKPENVLLDSQGFTVLIDLGFAKFVTEKTYTFCGTPFYIAPEIITQKGYNTSADVWSWGVMVYEMIVGMTPFYDKEMSQMALFKRIVQGKYSFPRGTDFMSGESKALLREILVTDPTLRLGCLLRGHQDIRYHPWFDKVDWEAIDKRKAPVPWKPNVKDPLDSSNFENWEHLEKVEKKERPLSAREQHLFDNY